MAIARITDIRGLVSLDNGISQEILKNKDVISEHGGLLTISEFANIVFDDGRVVEVTGPVSFNLDSSFFNEVTFEDSITQISDFASLDYINNDLEENIIEPQIEDSTLEQNNATIDIQSEQLDTQLNTQNTELVEENNSEFTQTQSTITFEDNIENEDEPVVDNDNQAPIANAEVNELNEDTIINGQIDFFDPDGTATVAVNGNIPTGLTLNPDGTYEFDASSYDSLAEGEIQNIEVPLTVTDNNGATTETTLTINIVGTNDAAIVSSATANLIETDTALTTSGTLTSTDVDNADNTFIANTIVGSKGTFTIDENGNWDFTANSAFNELNTGSTLSETFTVSSIDGTESTVTVNISGTNDAMTGFEMNEVNNFTEDSTSAGDTVTTVKTAPSDEDGGDI
ncbi:VCBS domain-containing protein, partial [Arcobacter arenosus]